MAEELTRASFMTEAAVIEAAWGVEAPHPHNLPQVAPGPGSSMGPTLFRPSATRGATNRLSLALGTTLGPAHSG